MRTFEARESESVAYRAPWQDRLPGPLSRLARFSWWQMAIALVAAVLLSQQILDPQSRVIKAAAGLVLFIIAFRTRPFYALCFIALTFAFPFSIFVGSSTMIFVVLALTIYLARLTLGQVPPMVRTPVDAGMGVLLGCYLLSFYNIDNPVILQRAIQNMFGILGSFLLFYLTANFIRTEDELKKFSKVLGVALSMIIFVGLYELFLPGRPLIPGWILGSGAVGHTQMLKGYRVGGPFYDFELYGEFMAVSFFLALFIFRRAVRPNMRFFTGVLTVLTIFALLTSVTRGATLAFMGGVIYFTWLVRHRLKFRDFAAALLVGLTLYLGLEFVVSSFTRSGSVFDRIFATHFVNGLPDSRAMWPIIWERVLEHPIVGHGPYYDLGLQRGLTGGGLYSYTWPHNQYLYYAHTIGILGTAAFLFVGIRLLIISFRDRAAGLQEPSFSRSFMLALHVMLLVFLVDELKIDYLRNPIYMYFPWLLMGLIAATHRIIQQQQKAGQGKLEVPTPG
jgi:O-antigen ligase